MSSPPSTDAVLRGWAERLLDLTGRNPMVNHRPSPARSLRLMLPDLFAAVDELDANGRGWRVFLEEERDAPPSDLDDPDIVEGEIEVHAGGDRGVASAAFTPPRAGLLALPPPPADGSAVRGGAAAAGRAQPAARRSAADPADPYAALREPEDGTIYFAGRDERPPRRHLTNLARDQRTALQERGVHTLFLAAGFLVTPEGRPGDVLRAPLLLFPVELRRKSARAAWELRPVAEEITVNPSARLILQRTRGVALPELPPPDAADRSEGGELCRRYFEMVREVLPRDGSLELREEAWLDCFSFMKLVIYEDLQRNAARIAAHPLVRQVAGQQEPAASSSEPAFLPPGELDRRWTPRDCYHVLDADSSQLVVLEAARRGVSMVLQGPPGTGKSQTIANLIGQSLKDGRSVLFVSEKMAALDVVKRRLEQQGLGPLCLELHSHRAAPREVVARIAKLLDEAVTPHGAPRLSDEELERLVQRRDALNAYVAALHAPRRPAGWSVARVLGEVATLHGIQPARLVPGTEERVLELDPRGWQRLDELARSLARHYRVIAEGAAFPWQGARPVVFSAVLRREVEEDLEALEKALGGLGEATAPVAEGLGVGAPRSFEAGEGMARLARAVATAPSLPAAFLDDAAAVRRAITEGRLIGEAIRDSAAALAGSLGSRPPCRAPAGGRLEAARDALSAAAGRAGVPAVQPADLTTREPGCGRLRGALPPVGAMAEGLERLLGLAPVAPDALRLGALARLASQLASGEELCGALLAPEGLRAARRLLAVREPLWAELRAAEQALEATWDAAVLGIELDRLAADFRTRHRGLLRIFSARYRADRRVVRAHLRADVPETKWPEALDLARRVRDLRARVEAGAAEDRALLGDLARGAATDVAGALARIDAAEAILRALPDRPLPAPLVRALSEGDLAVPGARVAAQRLVEAVEGLEAARVAAEATWPEGVDAAGWRARLDEYSACVARESEALGGLLTRAPWSGLSWEALAEGCAAWRRLETAEADLAAFEARHGATFGGRLAGTQTAWDELERDVRAAEAVLAAAPSPLPARLREYLLAWPRPEPLPLEGLEAALEAVRVALRAVADRFEGGRLEVGGIAAERAAMGSLAAHARHLRENLSCLEEVSAVAWLREEFEQLGWWDVAQAMLRRDLDGDGFLALWRRTLRTIWVDATMAREPALARFAGTDHEEAVREFRELDRRLIRAGTHRILEAIGDRRPGGVGGEVATLRMEANKKRRHKSIRQLMLDCPTILQRLQPCFLMSPLSVSQFLKDAEVRFDLVVFDEASQIFPEDAIGAIARAAQVVVCGDARQLPPTEFFRGTAHEDDDADEAAAATEPAAGVPAKATEDFGSILDRCAATFPAEKLRWHYRSRHEHLIAFSNRSFYESHLVTFPSPFAETPELGVHFHHVKDAVYGRSGARKNPAEARAIADLVARHLAERPAASLGVITLSTAQRDCVEDELERRARSDAALEAFLRAEGPEPFFVKNLENVQGDERDHIVLGLGYGPDKDRKMTANFGPINKGGGERRLNVAVTRARRSVDLVASFTFRDVPLPPGAQAGPRLLLRYLEFAERGVAALEPDAASSAASATGGHAESPLEESVAAAIRAMGHEPVAQVGCSGFRIDIAVRHPSHPGVFALGVECDGATYHSSATARDRDRLRQDILEGLGWRLHRIWGPDWHRHREREVRRLEQAIASACARPVVVPTPPAPPEPREEPPPGGAPGSGGGQPPTAPPPPARAWARRFRPTEVALPDKARGLHPEQVAGPTLAALMAECAAAENGVAVERAKRLLLGAFGLTRLGARIEAAFDGALGQLPPHVRLRDSFLYPEPYQPEVRVPDAAAGEPPRPLADVPPAELVLAARHLLLENGLSTDEDLGRSLLRLYGGTNLTDASRATADAAIALGLGGGELRRSEDGRLRPA